MTETATTTLPEEIGVKLVTEGRLECLSCGQSRSFEAFTESTLCEGTLNANCVKMSFTVTKPLYCCGMPELTYVIPFA